MNDNRKLKMDNVFSGGVDKPPDCSIPDCMRS